ncbi:MAG TPA: hypothetical protein PK096_00355 [Candidatus Saccharibacteria bacterium]|nr:hypothetical protein [Candidatus Saccharibacteria bacterium]HRK93807.1 hypothetical protein [Candidatus Saccharibacteria bacterium]
MASPSTHVIYIPGLGDHYEWFRSFGLKIWTLWGISAELVPSIWDDGQSLETKSSRVIAAINTAQSAGKRVILVGESAGAALALIVAANHRVEKVVTLCGVARANTPIAAALRKRVPALDQAVKALDNIVVTAPIVSLRAARDAVINKRYSIADGAESHVLWSAGHQFTVVLCLTVFSPYVVRVIQRASIRVI